MMSGHKEHLEEFAKMHDVTWRRGQDDAILEILAAKDSGTQCVILDAPTGSGKSLIAMALGWCLSREAQSSYVLVSDLTLQRQYVSDFEKLGLRWPSVMGVKNYECSESRTPVSVGWCSGNLVKLGVKRRDLPCYSGCGYYSARDAAQLSSVALLNYAYWLMQMNYVNLRLRRGEQSEGGFAVRDASIFDEAHKIDAIVHSHCAVKLDARLLAAISSMKHIVPPRARAKSVKLMRDIAATDRASWLPMIEELERLIGKMESAAMKWRSDLDPTVKRWDAKTTSLMHAAADLRDAHCKIEDYLQIVKPSVSDMTLTPEPSGAVLNTLDTQSLVGFMLNRSTRFRVLMSATWGCEKTAKRSIGANDAVIVKIRSDFDFTKSSLIVSPSGDMSGKSRDASLPNVAAALDALIAAHPGMRGVVHTSSYDIRDRLTALVSDASRMRLTPYDDTRGKEAALSRHSVCDDSVLIGPSLVEGINLPDDMCRFVVFAKCPYPYLGDDWTAKKTERDRQWYEWKTALAIEQGSGRGMRHANDWCNVFFLDSAFLKFFRNSKSFSAQFSERLRASDQS